jgi:hypothetical protein
MKKKTIQAKLFPFATRQPLWEMAKKYGRQKYAIVAIWDYMWWRSGKGGLFELAEELVCLDLECDPTTLRAVRRILQDEGWLKKELLRDKGGKWLTRGWTVIAKTTTKPKSLGGEVEPPSREPALVLTAVDSTSDGGTHHTVVLQSLDADASTPYCTPSASTLPDLSVSQSVSHAVAHPEKEISPEVLDRKSEEQNQNQPQEQDPEKPLKLEDENWGKVFKYLGLEVLRLKHKPLLSSIKRTLEQRDRNTFWLWGLVAWAKKPNPKDREATFWKSRLQTGERALQKLDEFLKVGTIAEQFDVIQAAQNPHHPGEIADHFRHGADTKGKSHQQQQSNNPNCSRCKGSTYGNPTYEDGKTLCADCMSMPYWRRQSGKSGFLGKGDI